MQKEKKKEKRKKSGAHIKNLKQRNLFMYLLTQAIKISKLLYDFYIFYLTISSYQKELSKIWINTPHIYHIISYIIRFQAV